MGKTISLTDRGRREGAPVADICFVIMPFGGIFDKLYEKVYAPAIRAVGLEPLRADEIYDNRPIIRDIDASIRGAKLILADVTGRNPNVNYELGAAHALKKEVVILTGNPQDVPSDYRHLRYLHYEFDPIEGSRKLAEDLEKTLRGVLDRIGQAERARRQERAGARRDSLRRAAQPSWMEEEADEEDWEAALMEEDERGQTLARAKELGFTYHNDSHNLSHALMQYKDSHVMLDSREGPVTEWQAAAACLLAAKVRALDRRLPQGHFLRMRSVFYDLYATHAFWVDYIHDRGTLPFYTAGEIRRALDDEFDGQIFEGQVRYLEEDVDHDRFRLDNDQYYGSAGLPEVENAVCLRDGFYVADLSDVYPNQNAGHCFYRLDGLLPLKELGGGAYAPGESHWLADWDQPEPRFARWDTVRFKVRKVSPPADRGHVACARNVTFAEVEVVQAARW